MLSGTRYRLDQQVGLQKRLGEDILRASTDISTRKRIQAPSDDPAAAARVADIQRAQMNKAAWTLNTNAALSLSDRVDGSLDTAATQMDRAKTLMLAASNATMSDTDREAIAVEIEGIAVDLAALSQEVDSRGQKLFADGAALAYPVGATVSVQAGATRAGIFDAITTAAGPKDLSAILSDAAIAIRTPDRAERDLANDVSLAELDAASNSISDAHAEQGVRATRLTAIRERLADSTLIDREERSGLEDTDIDTAVAEMKARLVALEAAQAVLAKMSKNNLFDLI
jgi:flagellar hook-associated protein 3 FlgL